ncbi:MAG: hypothetical protein ACOX6T_01165 [Myxococcales bacterium]|jgi:hypothetical protein
MPPVQASTPGAPQKKKTNGCLIALGVVGGVFLLGLLAVGILIWRVAASEEGQKAMKLIGGSVSILQKATTAPGTAELRKLGCEQAMVLDFKELRALIDQAKMKSNGPLPDLLTVTCSIGRRSNRKPTCAEVSRTYLEAARPQEVFLVAVQSGPRDDPECVALFDASGKELPLDAAELPFDPAELGLPAEEEAP